MAIGNTKYYKRGDNYLVQEDTGNNKGLIDGGYTDLGDRQGYINSLQSDIAKYTQLQSQVDKGTYSTGATKLTYKDGTGYAGYDPYEQASILQKKLAEAQAGGGQFADNYNSGSQVINGNFTTAQDIAKENVNKQAVAAGTMKVTGTQNGVSLYAPTTPFNSPSPSGPSPTANTTGGQQTPALAPYTGASVVDYLNSRGIDSSLANRVRLAQANGVAGYSITAPTGTQNTQLLQALKSKESAMSPGISQGGGTTPQGDGTQSQVNEYQRINDEYKDFYNASGLSSIKTQYEKLVKDQVDLQNKMAEEVASVNNNPWLSEGQRAKQVANVATKYDSKLDALTNAAKLMETMYEQGMEEVRDKVGFAERSREKAFELAQKTQEAKDKLAEDDIHPATVNGRSVLVDYKTRKIVADLGPDKVAGSGSGINNQTIDNERALLTDFHNQPIVKNYNTVLSQKLLFDRILDSKLGGPGDLSLIYNFMKGLDPNSVVRETEYATAAKSGNIFAGVYTRFNGYLKEEGGFLPENVKKSFKSVVDSSLAVQEQLYKNTAKEYTDISIRQGLDPRNVVVNYNNANTSMPPTKSQFDNIQSSITINGKNAYLPRNVWANVSDKDALLQEARNDGYTLLIND